MFELLKSMGFALIMVPVVMAAILALIYGLGGLFNIISRNETKGSIEQ
ncbi:AcrZ family multidrug efflux pump-associated protein [Xenorhabdus sp. Sc-CR9]|nr:AcrZ family multidrug efflux pump-associated protein [Xenorhabdus sp. Sc-CR9]